MAKLEIAGIDGILVKLEKRDRTLTARMDKALTLAAEHVQAAIRKDAAKSFKQPTGELAGLVAPGPVWHYDNRSVVSVWAKGTYTGKRGRPRRAAMIGALIQYGVPPYIMHGGMYKGALRGRQEKNPWYTRSLKASGKAVNSIIEEVMNG